MIRVFFKLRTWLTFVALMAFSVEAIAQGVTTPDVTEISAPVGSLRGKVSPNGTVIEFKGIRYAAPPVRGTALGGSSTRCTLDWDPRGFCARTSLPASGPVC